MDRRKLREREKRGGARWEARQSERDAFPNSNVDFLSLRMSEVAGRQTSRNSRVEQTLDQQMWGGPRAGGRGAGGGAGAAPGAGAGARGGGGPGAPAGGGRAGGGM